MVPLVVGLSFLGWPYLQKMVHSPKLKNITAMVIKRTDGETHRIRLMMFSISYYLFSHIVVSHHADSFGIFSSFKSSVSEIFASTLVQWRCSRISIPITLYNPQTLLSIAGYQKSQVRKFVYLQFWQTIPLMQKTVA